MDSTEEKKLFEDEKIVIISSTREIDMRQWPNQIKNWDMVGFLSSLIWLSERMASVNQKRFEDENLVIISSNTEIDMTQWRKYLVENWDKVFQLSVLSLIFVPDNVRSSATPLSKNVFFDAITYFKGDA